MDCGKRGKTENRETSEGALSVAQGWDGDNWDQGGVSLTWERKSRIRDVIYRERPLNLLIDVRGEGTKNPEWLLGVLFKQADGQCFLMNDSTEYCY